MYSSCSLFFFQLSRQHTLIVRCSFFFSWTKTRGYYFPVVSRSLYGEIFSFYSEVFAVIGGVFRKNNSTSFETSAGFLSNNHLEFSAKEFIYHRRSTVFFLYRVDILFVDDELELRCSCVVVTEKREEERLLQWGMRVIYISSITE